MEYERLQKPVTKVNEAGKDLTFILFVIMHNLHTIIDMHSYGHYNMNSDHEMVQLTEPVTVVSLIMAYHIFYPKH